MDYGSDAFGGLFVGLWTSMMCLGWVIPMLLAAASVAVWIIAVVDVVQRLPEDFPNARAGRDDPNERLIWLLIVLLVGTLGAVVYYFVVMKPYPRPRPGAAVAAPTQPQAPVPGDAAEESSEAGQ